MSKPQTYTIRNNYIESQSWEGSMSEMARILDATHPKEVIGAGEAYTAVADKFAESIGELRAQAAALANVWKGKDADEAQKQMQRLHASARELHERSKTTGKTITDHGTKLEWYKTHAPKEGFMKGVDLGDVTAFAYKGLIGVAAKRAFIGSQEDNAAREHMNRLQGRTLEANGYMPEEVTTDLPDPGQGIWRPEGRPPGGHPPGGMPPGGMPGGGGGGGGNLPKDPFGNGGGGNLPHDPFGNGGAGGGGSHLPKDPFGGGGGGGGTNLAGMPHGPGGAGGGGLGGDPFGKGGLGGGAGGGPGGGPGGLSGGAPGMPGGLGGGARGAGAGRGVGGRGAGGMGGAPMGGGAGGGKGGEEERERSTWLTEDEDVWGGNDGDTAPPVIG